MAQTDHDSSRNVLSSWPQLPEELLANILRREPACIAHARLTCSAWGTSPAVLALSDELRLGARSSKHQSITFVQHVDRQ
jgi:hypothetical protein